MLVSILKKGGEVALKDLKVAEDYRELSSFDETYHQGCDGPYERTIVDKVFAFGTEWDRHRETIDQARDCHWSHWGPVNGTQVPEGYIYVVQGSYEVTSYPTQGSPHVFQSGELINSGSFGSGKLLAEGERTKVWSQHGDSSREWFVENRGGKAIEDHKTLAREFAQQIRERLAIAGLTETQISGLFKSAGVSRSIEAVNYTSAISLDWEPLVAADFLSAILAAPYGYARAQRVLEAAGFPRAGYNATSMGCVLRGAIYLLYQKSRAETVAV